jgi:hypothetical protein
VGSRWLASASSGAEHDAQSVAQFEPGSASGYVSVDELEVARLGHSGLVLDHDDLRRESDGTISSYRMELKTAMDELDETTPVAEITAERVREFFTSKRVTKLRSGKSKSQLSIDKTREVLRLALVWAAERGIVASAPIPEPAPAK